AASPTTWRTRRAASTERRWAIASRSTSSGTAKSARSRSRSRRRRATDMIARYCRPEMAQVWSDERRLALWLDVELAATGAREARGEVPGGTVERVRQQARIDPARMLAIEAEVHHDVIAFVSMLAETAGDDARHLHVGLTS